MISQQEYIQFKAFVRYDGLWVGALLTVTLLLFVSSLTMPQIQLIALMSMLAAPVFVFKRIAYYRDYIIEKSISFRRSWAYSMLSFMYGGMILAACGFAYMKFLDGGMLVGTIYEMMQRPEMIEVFKAYGFSDSERTELLDAINMLSPLDFSASLFSNTLTSGFVVSLLIALFTRKKNRIQ